MTNINFKSGQMLIIGILFLTLLLIFSTTIFTKVRFFLNFGTNATLREQARHVAEAGVDYAAREITANSDYAGTVLPGPLFIDVGTTGNFEVDVQQDSANLKTVTVTGYVPKFLGFKAKTAIQITFKPEGAGNTPKMRTVTDNAIVENNNYIYSIGGAGPDGCSLRGVSDLFQWYEPDFQFSKINSSGPEIGYLQEPFRYTYDEAELTPLPVRLARQFPETRRAPGVVADTTNGFIYAIAGRGGCWADRTTVFYTQPNLLTGEITTWSEDTDSPTPEGGSVYCSFVYNNHAYIIQEQSISYAPLEALGGLGTWDIQNGATPAQWASCVFANGYVYFFGGNLHGTDLRNVWFAKVNTGPLDFSVDNPIKIQDVLPTNTTLSAAATANGYIYVIGGRKTVVNPGGGFDGPPAKSVYYQKIKANHSLDPFLTSPKNLPNPRWADTLFGSISRNNKIFLFGGLEDPTFGSTTGTIWVTDVDAADLDSDGDTGEISDWTDNGGFITYTGWGMDKTTYIYK